MFESTEGYRNGYSLERYGINPTASLKPGTATVVTLGYEHYHDDRTADRGIPSLNGRPYPTDAPTFFGDPTQAFAKADVDAFNALVQHDFGGGLTLRNNTRYGDYDRMYQNFVPGAVSIATGTDPITAYNNATRRKNLFNQTDFVWMTATGEMRHTFLGGVEIGRQDTVNHRNTGFYSVGPSTNLSGTISTRRLPCRRSRRRCPGVPTAQLTLTTTALRTLSAYTSKTRWSFRRSSSSWQGSATTRSMSTSTTLDRVHPESAM